MSLNKKQIIERAEKLSTLDGNPGWEIVEKMIKDGISACQEKVFNSKKVNNWNIYLEYRAKYDSYTKLLFLIDKWKKDGLKAKEDASD